MNQEELLQLENELSFTSFCHRDAFCIGQMIIKKINQERLKPVRIRVVMNHDIVFQYLMDGKTGTKWLDYKQNTLEKYQHSTYYVYKQHQDDLLFQDEELKRGYVICGGGFPLIVKHQIIGGIYVSGLEHDQDHQVIVDVLKEYKNECTS